MTRDLLPMRGPDTCPVCTIDHRQIGDHLACGEHGHRLLFKSPLGDRVFYYCPAHRCPVVITAPRNPQPTKGDTMTTQPAIHHPQQPLTELAIRDDQKQFDKYQLAALRTRGIENVPTPELMVFFHHCKTRGLDPLAGHATIVPFKEADGSKRWTIITEIDGYRYLGHREANRRGDVIAMPDPVYVDQAGNETTHWVKPPTEPPGMVKQTILKNGAPFTGAANYWEFRKTGRDGKPTGRWRDMPANQTAKCAEAQAWRKAYQEVFRNLPMEINVQAEPAATPWHVAATAPRSKMARDVPPVPTAAERIRDDLQRIGVVDEDEQFNLAAALAGTDTVIDNLADIPLDDLERVAHQLVGCEDVGQVHALIEAGDKPGT